MNEIINLANLVSNTSFISFFMGLVSTVVFTLIIRFLYIKYSRSVSNKRIVSNLFPIFGISIFLIVITIKSSIVLSLGLVGALSIIRFRTAIKEPEQIIYFLFVTAIAIATAAESFLFPMLTLCFLFLYISFLQKKETQKVYSINDQLVLTTGTIENHVIKELVILLNTKGMNVEIQSINKKDVSCVIVLKLSDFDFDCMDTIDTFLNEKKIEKIELQFFSSTE